MAPGIDIGTHHIADYLSNHGFVVLRYDSRGSGDTKYGSLMDADYETLVADARAALKALLRRPEVTRREMFIVGHSLGALTAMRLVVDAERLPIKGLVMLSPPGRLFGEILVDQALRESRRLNFSPEQVDARRKNMEESLSRLRASSPDDSQESASGVASISTKLLRELLDINPVELFVKVNVPILICQGGKDIQVSIEKDTLRLVEVAGRASMDAEVRIFPDLDHLFKVEPGTSLPDRYYVERPIGPAFLRSVLSWLDGQGTASD
jgi:uncharacterized protein